MDVAQYVDHLEAEGFALASAASVTSLAAAIPMCPDWTVRDVLAHVGTVHRWATAIVSTPLDSPAVPEPDLPEADELVEWFRAGHRGVVKALRAAPADLECWFLFRGQSPQIGWARRQALETAIHRLDVEGAGGGSTPIDAALALDGMQEFLLGFGRRRNEFAPGTLRLAPAGGAPWHVTLSAEGLAATQDDPGTPPDVTVSGSASAVYQWMWNRPADVHIEGATSVAEQWKQIAVRWG